jgi:hypothetical protein
MTAEQHNKYLAYAHIVYAAFHSLLGVFMGFMMFMMLSTMPGHGAEPPPAFFVFMGLFLLIFTVGWTIPSMIAAYGLLKRKRWAKTAGIVAGVFAASQLPVGTAVCVYTFWFLFSENGRQLYDRPGHPLPPAPPTDWATLNRQSGETSQFQPTTMAPPDWR